MLGNGLNSAQVEIGAKKPRVWWLASKALALFLSEKRRRNLTRRLTDTSRTADVFRRYNRYLILRLSTS